jgi:hypothetical protein
MVDVKFTKTQKRRFQRQKRIAKQKRDLEAKQDTSPSPLQVLTSKQGSSRGLRNFLTCSNSSRVKFKTQTQFSKSTVLPNDKKPNLLISSYIQYPGCRGSFGQFGTAWLNVHVGPDVTTRLSVGVKSHLPSSSRDLNEELQILQKAQGITVVPKLYGSAWVPNQPHIWSIVMERVPITFRQWYRGGSSACALQLPDCRRSPVDGIEFHTQFFQKAFVGLSELHRRGIAHADIKPSNMGGIEFENAIIPVTDNASIRLVMYDYSLSTDPKWYSGSFPYSQKYWFDEPPSPHVHNIDYFQCLIVVTMLIASPDSSFLDKDNDEFKVGAKTFASTWLGLQQENETGWVKFLLDHTACSQPFHSQVCLRAQQKYVASTPNTHELYVWDRIFSAKVTKQNVGT